MSAKSRLPPSFLYRLHTVPHAFDAQYQDLETFHAGGFSLFGFCFNLTPFLSKLAPSIYSCLFPDSLEPWCGSCHLHAFTFILYVKMQ